MNPQLRFTAVLILRSALVVAGCVRPEYGRASAGATKPTETASTSSQDEGVLAEIVVTARNGHRAFKM